MKIFLAHAYFLHEDPREQKIMKPYPPLGILYLSAWLEKHGYQNNIFDSTFRSREELKDELFEKRPEIIALYTNLMTKLNIVDIVRFIRSKSELRDCLIVIGGPDTTYNFENYIAIGGDVIVLGEGEQTMLEITQARERNQRPDWRKIPGLAFQNDKGIIVKTVARSKMRDLEDLPLPNRKKIDLSKYLDTWKKHHGRSAISVSTQRGCPYTCRWCSTAVYGQSYRRRSPSSVVDELQFLKDQYNPDQIWFVDDVFTVSHKWIDAFYEEMKSRNFVIAFEIITRAERLNDQILQKLKELGCFRIWIGAESGSQRIIDAMDRRVDVNQVRQMIRLTRKNGIEAGTFIMIGYPGETEEDIFETVNHLRESNPNVITVTLAYPIKGTGLYQEVQSHSDKLDWATTTDRDIDFRRTYPSSYYKYALPWLIRSVARNNSNHSFSQTVMNVFKIKLLRMAMIFYRSKKVI